MKRGFFYIDYCLIGMFVVVDVCNGKLMCAQNEHFTAFFRSAFQWLNIIDKLHSNLILKKAPICAFQIVLLRRFFVKLCIKLLHKIVGREQFQMRGLACF